MTKFLLACLMSGSALAGLPAAAIDLHDYSAIPIHRGMNDVDLGVAGHPATIVVGHRPNWDAHSFDVTTFYLPKVSPGGELDIVGFWEATAESLYLTTAGGADCLFKDFRVLKSSHGALAAVVLAERQRSDTTVDPAVVLFKIFTLSHSEDGLPGTPTYSFRLQETRKSKAAYCDVGKAFASELGLPEQGVWRGP